MRIVTLFGMEFQLIYLNMADISTLVFYPGSDDGSIEDTWKVGMTNEERYTIDAYQGASLNDDWHAYSWEVNNA